MKAAPLGFLALNPSLAGARDRTSPIADNRKPTAQFIPQRLSRFDRQKGEWLLRERLPCLGCHRIGGQGGVIGPDLGGVADRRSAQFIFNMITDPQATLGGSRMPRVPMPPDWARLVASYLAQDRTAAARPSDPESPADTQRLSCLEDTGTLYQPEVGDGDVLVRVHAAGLDPGVWHLHA